MLSAFSDKAHAYAADRLQHLGVKLLLGTGVTEVTDDRVKLTDGSEIKTRTVVWGGGIKADALAGFDQLDRGRAGRLTALPDLTVAGHPNVYAIGDVANIPDHDGKIFPSSGRSPCRPGGGPRRTSSPTSRASPRTPFRYHDKGIMAMIGHGAAVAEMGPHHHELHGRVAFAAWLGVHAWLMSGVRNRIDAFVSWAWDFLGSSRGTSIIDPEDARIDWGDEDDDVRVKGKRLDGRPLRRHHHRQRRGRRHARPRAGRVGQADPASSNGATTCRGRWTTGSPGPCSSTASTSPSRPGTTPTTQPFQPQVHYFVGGATKLYGAALYRLRPQDFGELKHVDGISPAWPLTYDDFEPWYSEAEWLYQVHGNGGEDPTEGHRSKPYPWPAVSHEPRIQQLVRRPPERAATTRSTRRAASCSTRPTGPRATASAARGATATRAWCTPSPTPRPSPSDRSSTGPT